MILLIWSSCPSRVFLEMLFIYHKLNHNLELIQNVIFRPSYELCPREESNLHNWLRSPVFYPLNYGGFTDRVQVLEESFNTHL